MLVASLSKFLSSPSKSPRKRVSRKNPFSVLKIVSYTRHPLVTYFLT
jgi:hypothetical protein